MSRLMFERYGGFKTVRTIVSAFYEKMLYTLDREFGSAGRYGA